VRTTRSVGCGSRDSGLTARQVWCRRGAARDIRTRPQGTAMYHRTRSGCPRSPVLTEAGLHVYRPTIERVGLMTAYMS
jgi:hypothetical protein